MRVQANISSTTTIYTCDDGISATITLGSIPDSLNISSSPPDGLLSSSGMNSSFVFARTPSGTGTGYSWPYPTGFVAENLRAQPECVRELRNKYGSNGIYSAYLASSTF